jgi:hypothetical protein
VIAFKESDAGTEPGARSGEDQAAAFCDTTGTCRWIVISGVAHTTASAGAGADEDNRNRRSRWRAGRRVHPPPRAWPVRPPSRGYASGNYDYLIRLRKIDG